MTDDDGFLFLDYVNLPFHEFGHILFGVFGDTLGVWGGKKEQKVKEQKEGTKGVRP